MYSDAAQLGIMAPGILLGIACLILLITSIASIVVFFKMAGRIREISKILDAWRNSGVPTRQ